MVGTQSRYDRGWPVQTYCDMPSRSIVLQCPVTNRGRRHVFTLGTRDDSLNLNTRATRLARTA